MKTLLALIIFMVPACFGDQVFSNIVTITYFPDLKQITVKQTPLLPSVTGLKVSK